jgi:hypothetical protein
MPAEFAELKAENTLAWSEGSCFAYVWEMTESYVLRHVCDYCSQKKLSQLAKAFDGVPVDFK